MPNSEILSRLDRGAAKTVGVKSGSRSRLHSPRSRILSVWSKNAPHPGEVFNADFLQRREIGGCLGGRTKIAALVALNPAKRCQILKLAAGRFSRQPAAIG